MVRALHDLKVGVERRGVERGARLTRAAADHIDGLALQVTGRGAVAVRRGKGRDKRAVFHRFAGVQYVAGDARGRQLDVRAAAGRAADLRGVGAQHIAEQDLLELLCRDVRRLDRGVRQLDRLPRRRGVVGGFKVRKRKFHARVAWRDRAGLLIIRRVDLLSDDGLALRAQVDLLRGDDVVNAALARRLKHDLGRVAAAQIRAV